MGSRYLRVLALLVPPTLPEHALCRPGEGLISSRRGTGTFVVRPLEARDRGRIAEIVRATGKFSPAECDVALELVDEALARGEESGYLVHVFEDEGKVQGYVCFGPTPLTQGTWDLYWIAVDPESQGRGAGRALLAFAEDSVRRRGGRLLLIETSSQESYGATVRFYERAGYTLEARIRDFYKPGDDKLVFVRQLGS